MSLLVEPLSEGAGKRDALRLAGGLGGKDDGDVVDGDVFLGRCCYCDL